MNIQLFDYSVNLIQTILLQYTNALAINTLINAKQEWYDVNQEQFWQDWYNNVFNLQTCNEFGLAVWSIILNIPLFLASDTNVGRPLWGFNNWDSTPINDYKNFNNGNFASGAHAIVLSVEEQRLILRLRYYQLVSRGDIPTTNQALNTVFQDCYGEGNTCWILDGLRMFIVAVFTFNVPTAMRQVLVNYDLIPRSAGVGIEYRVLTDNIWGFSDWSSTPINDYKNFGNGGFAPSFV